jgi:hypothetical protein
MDDKSKDDNVMGNALKLIAQVVGIIGTVVTIVTGAIIIYKNIEENKSPVFMIENNLTLPIIVIVNDTHTERIQAGYKKNITLLSAAEFPASVRWKVQRNKNNAGQLLGEDIGEEIKRVDKGAELIVDNEIGLANYFFPVIVNNTDSKCNIIINDGLSIKYSIGMSSPHATTNTTGYYKYAANSNVTLKCADATYYYGERNGKQGTPFELSIGNGIVNFPIP